MSSSGRLGWVGIILIGACLMGFWEEVVLGMLGGGLSVFILCVLFD